MNNDYDMMNENEKNNQGSSASEKTAPISLIKKEDLSGNSDNRSTQFSKLKSFVSETVQTVVLALILYLLIDAVIARVRVENISMQPTLAPGEFLLVNKLAYKFDEPQRGDIIVFHYPNNPSEDYIKRVIGIPGDDIRIAGGRVYINGNPVEEPYIGADYSYENGQWLVPDESLFVLGDNRKHSSDSEEWGYVPMGFVVGKALVIYWPLDKVEVISKPYPVRAAN